MQILSEVKERIQRTTILLETTRMTARSTFFFDKKQDANAQKLIRVKKVTHKSANFTTKTEVPKISVKKRKRYPIIPG